MGQRPLYAYTNKDVIVVLIRVLSDVGAISIDSYIDKAWNTLYGPKYE